MKKVLAIDMGATSIRGILAYVVDGKLETREVMRQAHHMVCESGRWYWQWDVLIKAISETIIKYASEISAIGIDTWGVDFGLIGENGQLLDTPITYRDDKHQLGIDICKEKFTLSELFKLTGNQISGINSLFQILALRELSPDLFAKAKKILLMPDLVKYFLTGNMSTEASILSTTQMLNLADKNLQSKIFSAFALNENLIPECLEAGCVVGSTKTSLLPELREFDIKVVNVAGHDTAGAVLLTEAVNDNECLFLSCGTWSLLGACVDHAYLTDEVQAANLTNELGVNGQPLLLQNITGLYLLEQYKKQLESALGQPISFNAITEHVSNHTESYPCFDIDQPVFGQANVKAKQAIDQALQANGCNLPINSFDYFGVIYSSLVAKYKTSIDNLVKLTGKSFKRLHLIGGGSQSSYLCQLIANKTGVEVIAGPKEASALGNIIVQLQAVGAIKSLAEGRKLSEHLSNIHHYYAKGN